MRITKKDKTALAIVGAAIALYVVFQFAIFPVWDTVQEARSNLALEEKKLEKYRSAALTIGLRKSEASSVEARLRESEAGLLNSKTAALAAAEVQQIAMDAAAAQQIELRTMEFAPVKALAPQYVQVPVSMQFQCRVDELAGFLHAIEGHQKYLTVPKLLIQNPGAGAKSKSIIVVTTIAGVMRAEPAKQDGGGAKR